MSGQEDARRIDTLRRQLNTINAKLEQSLQVNHFMSAALHKPTDAVCNVVGRTGLNFNRNLQTSAVARESDTELSSAAVREKIEAMRGALRKAEVSGFECD